MIYRPRPGTWISGGKPATRLVGPDKWVALEPIKFKRHDGRLFYAPIGTISDLSSFPNIVEFVMSIFGHHPRNPAWDAGSFLHDEGYRCGWLLEIVHDAIIETPMTRLELDMLYADCAVSNNESIAAPEWAARLFYDGLRAGGWRAWNRYRRLDAR